METTAMSLKEQWIKLKKDNPKIRIRNAAKELGCTEVELLVTHCGDGVIRLKADFEGILQEIPKLGYVMALTRNDDVVHERKGVYDNWSSTPHAALFVGADIDLRIFLKQWASAFAVTEGAGDKKRYSIQFFGKDGVAVHKIYITPDSVFGEYESLIEKFKMDEQEKSIEVVSPEPAKPEMPDEQIDVDSLRKGWLELQDTHDFYMLLGKHRVSRTQALRLAPEGDYAIPVENSALRKTFNMVVERNIPIMVFVGNKGMIQIHTGEIHKLLDHQEWFNVLDPEFNLHVREKAIVQSWVVRKPSRDGMVTSLELFDSKGEQLATIFGKRKPGIPELESWRQVIGEVEKELKK